jgi:hypothetical protein
MRTLGDIYAFLSILPWRLLAKARMCSLMPFLPSFYFSFAADNFPSNDAALFMPADVARIRAFVVHMG